MNLIRFDAESWVCVHLAPHSHVVTVCSNLADEQVANLYADAIRQDGGHVFQVCKAGILIAALQLIKSKGVPHEDTSCEVAFARMWLAEFFAGTLPVDMEREYTGLKYRFANGERSPELTAAMQALTEKMKGTP